MARWSSLLRQAVPRSGRAVKEDGTTFNHADWEYFREWYSLKYQTIHNGAVIISVRSSGVDTSPYYLGLSVPEGRKLFLFHRDLSITEGNYNVDVVFAADGFTGGSIGPKFPLNDTAPNNVQSDLYAGVIPSGTITERYLGMIDTGVDVGAGRSGGASGTEEVLQVYTGNPMIRIDRLSTDPYRVVVQLIAWEEDA